MITYFSKMLRENWKSIMGFCAGVLLWILFKESISGLSYPVWGYFVFGAIDFDGAGGVDLGAGVSSISGSISISAWIKTSTSGAVQMIVGNRQAAAPNPGFEFQVTSAGKLLFFLDVGAGTGAATGLTDVNDGELHHVVAVRDAGTQTRVYLDGEDDTDIDVATVGSISSSDNTWIGREPLPAGPSYFTGLIDEVVIYDIALSADQVEQLYRAGLKARGDQVSPDDRVADLRMDDGALGSSAHTANIRDYSESGNNGTGNGAGLTFEAGTLSYLQNTNNILQEVTIVPVGNVGALLNGGLLEGKLRERLFQC